MALINCPECGKENVSDSANMCPECGFGIDKYMVEQKYKKNYNDELNREVELRVKKQNEINNAIAEDTKMPRKPRLIIRPSSILCILFLILPIYGVISHNLSSDEILISIFMACIFGFLCGFYSWKAYKSELELYNIANDNFYQYLAIINEDFKNTSIEKIRRDIMSEREEIINPREFAPIHQIKCPTCSSTEVSKIGGVERAASVFGLGIFSKKINKSFKCKSCGYTW